MGQGFACPSFHIFDTSVTSGDEKEAIHARRRVRSKRTYKLKVWGGAAEVGPFLVTGATYAVGKPSHFFCHICRKDVSVLTHGADERLRHYKGFKHFPRDQRLRQETPG